VKANYEGNNASIKKDKWGFTLANFRRPIPFGGESCAFPMHVEQVYFVDAREDPGWKIVLHKEIRGRRMYGDYGVNDEDGMFVIGDDTEHEGLCPAPVIAEKNEAPIPTGRILRRDEALAE